MPRQERLWRTERRLSYSKKLKLSKYTSYKKTDQYSYAIGAFPTIELLKYRPRSVTEVIISSSKREMPELDKLLSNGVEVLESDKTISRITKQDNAWVVGVFEKYETPLSLGANHVVLVEPEDAGNMGTIMRTMLALGTRDLAVVGSGVDSFSPKVIRASMGAMFSVNVEYFETFADYQVKFSDQQIYPFMSNAELQLADLKSAEPFSLVFGAESKGLGDDFVQIGTPVQIPISSKVDSLNLAISVAIGLYAAKHG